MTTTGTAPGGAYVPLAYGGENYKIDASALVSTASGGGAAWVNFDGCSTVGINDSFNVDSITDEGVGQYTVNLGITMTNPSTGYAAISTAGRHPTNTDCGSVVFTEVTDFTPTSFKIVTRLINTGGTTYDQSYIGAAVFGSYTA